MQQLLAEAGLMLCFSFPQFIKVLFATETFAMGLNMPARTVVFTQARLLSGYSLRLALAPDAAISMTDTQVGRRVAPLDGIGRVRADVRARGAARQG